MTKNINVENLRKEQCFENGRKDWCDACCEEQFEGAKNGLCYFVVKLIKKELKKK